MKKREKIIIIGAGVVGLTIALELFRKNVINSDNTDVTFLEKASMPGCGSSFANGGNITIAEGLPMSKPLNKELALNFFPNGLQIREDNSYKGRQKWIETFNTNCQKDYSDWLRRAGTIADIGKRSVQKWVEIASSYPDLMKSSEFNYGDTNLIRVYTNQEAMVSDLNLLKSLNINIKPLNLAEMNKFDSALKNSKANLVGGINQPGGSIDPHKFSNLVTKLLKENFNVNFCFNTEVCSFKINDKNAIEEVRTNNGIFSAEKIIVSTCASLDFFHNESIHEMIQPIAGCAITVPMLNGFELKHPLKYITEDGVIVLSPHFLGKKLRLGGLFFFGDSELNHEDYSLAYSFKKLEKYLNDLFPDLYENIIRKQKQSGENLIEKWHGLRPMTSNGLPLIGKYFHENLYLCLGQGAAGSSYAPACAEILSRSLKQD